MSPAGVRIRAESPSDPAEAAAIGRLHDAAFEDPQVARLVVAIRDSPWYLPDLSLVADLPALPGTPVVGHVMISGTELAAEDGRSIPILMLSPLGVLPAHQARGIGSALNRAILDLADQRDEPLVIVQGHPGYYPRFGFVRGRSIGVLPPEHLGAIDLAWMVRRRPGAPEVRGRVAYPPAFLELDG
jgi:putative acetyltransferase